jgi:hypothetical protein
LDLSNTTTDDAQKLWDDLAAERDSGTEQTAAMPPAAAEAQPGANDTAADVTTTDDQTKGETTDTAAKQEGNDATAQAAAKDPMAELMERFSNIEGQLRKVNGHIGGLTQSQQQLREQVLNAAKQATANAGKEAPTNAQAKAALADPEKWAALKAEWPEWGEAVEEVLAARIPQAPAFDPTEFDRKLDERVAAETAKVREEAVNAHLDTIVDGDWRATVKSEEFGKWMAAQPDEVKALGDSPSLADASKMIRLFVKSKQPNPAQQLINERSAKLDAAASAPQPGRKAPRTKGVDDMSPEELWAYYSKQTDARRG